MKPSAATLDDFASLCARQGRLEHGLVDLRVKFVADCGNDRVDAVLFEHGNQLAHRDFDAFEQGFVHLFVFSSTDCSARRMLS